MSLSESDIQAVNRVLEAVMANPALLQDPRLELLREWAASLGATIPSAPPASASAKAHPAHAAEDENEEDTSDAQSEPDAERWELTDDAPADGGVPDKAGEPSDADAEAAMALKGEAAELFADGKTAEAVEKLTAALRLVPRNAMYWGLRSQYNLQLSRPRAALQDADRALSINPQNVRALRVRGTVLRHTGDWEAARESLKDAQAIDYDESVDATLKFVQTRLSQRHQREVQRQQAREEAEQRRQREEEARAAASASASSTGMPGRGTGTMPGAMPGMPPGMDQLFNDPELLAAMQDPDVGPKLASCMQNPAMMMQMMNDPKVGPVLQKLVEKMMPGMAGGMGGGMPPGGMGGGMPPGGMGGASAAPPQRGHGGDDLD